MRIIVRLLVWMMLILVCQSCRSIIYEDEFDSIIPEPTPCVMEEAPIFHPGEMLHGRVSGLKNCRPFMATAEAHYVKLSGENWGINIKMNAYEDWGFFYANKEFLSVTALSLNEGQYPMYNPHNDTHLGDYYTTQDHDVFEDVFDLDPFYSHNEIHYVKVDRESMSVEGYFNCRFIIDSHVPSGHNPDTVLFSDCHFIADIIE